LVAAGGREGKGERKYFSLGVFGCMVERKEEKSSIYISFVCFAKGRERKNICFYLYAFIYVYLKLSSLCI
jgi:hypothetical protein